jgi:hypothetical protein
MGDFLDRTMQRQLLAEMRDEYPHQKFYKAGADEAGRRLAVNLHYLWEHGLIDGRPMFSGTGDKSSNWPVKLTHRGMDFLADDGGLSAILGVVTVRLHDDTIRQLLEKSITEDPAASPAEKKGALEILRKMPERAVGAVIEDLAKKGIEHFPNLVPYLLQVGHAALHAAGVA